MLIFQEGAIQPMALPPEQVRQAVWKIHMLSTLRYLMSRNYLGNWITVVCQYTGSGMPQMPDIPSILGGLARQTLVLYLDP